MLKERIKKVKVVVVVLKVEVIDRKCKWRRVYDWI